MKRFTIDSDGVTEVAANPDGKTLSFVELKGATGSNRLASWDLDKSNIVGLFPEVHEDEINSLAYSTDGRFIATGSDDKTLAIGRSEGRTLVKKIAGYDGWISAAAFGKDGKTVVAGSWDKTVRLWDIEAGAQIRRINCSKRINSIAITADGKVLVVGYHETSPRLYELNTGKEIRVLRLPAGQK